MTRTLGIPLSLSLSFSLLAFSSLGCSAGNPGRGYDEGATGFIVHAPDGLAPDLYVLGDDGDPIAVFSEKVTPVAPGDYDLFWATHGEDAATKVPTLVQHFRVKGDAIAELAVGAARLAPP